VKPIRTALFAPGIKERVMTKALESGADAVIFDLEDSVPVAAKAEARVLVAKAIDAAVAAASRPAIFVRINSVAAGMLTGDLDAVVRPGLDAILLAKAESVAEVESTAAGIARCESARSMKAGGVEIILQIESALGVYRCFDLVKASPRVGATSLGSARDGDLQTDLGCSWSNEGTELLYSRSKVLLETRAAGALPLDGPYADLNDEAGLVADSRLSARLGYIGRALIHPKQIGPVRQAYAVPEAQAAYYRKVVAEFEAAEKTGTAAIQVEGKLIDYAMYQRAKRVLEFVTLDS
jgi:citrate lyase subunit beta / citryl-CoA lyase